MPTRPPFHWTWYGFMIGLAIAVAAVVSPLHRGITGDTLWHLADGRWILAHHRIPQVNPFGWSTGKTPWINIEWGWDVVTAWLVDTLGRAGITLWLAALIGGLAWVQHRRWNALNIGDLAQGDWIFLTLLGTSVFWAWRPQLVSYAMVPLWLYTLEQAPTHLRKLWWLLPELFVWQLFHGGYVLGLLCLGLWGLDYTVTWWTTRPTSFPWRLALGIGIGLGLVLGLTPWGWNDIGHALWEIANPIISRDIAEWQSPNFHSLWWLGLIGVPTVAIGVQMWRHPQVRDQVSRFQWLIWAAFLGGTLLSVRNYPFFAEQCAILGAGLGVWHPAQRTPPLNRWVMLGILAVLGFAVTPEVRAWEQVHTGISPRIAAFLRQPAHAGRVLNGYRAGDGLVYLGIPDSLDGRTDLYTATHPDWFVVSEAAESGTMPWPRLHQWLQHEQVRYVLWPTARAGTEELLGRPGITPLMRGDGLMLLQVHPPRP